MLHCRTKDNPVHPEQRNEDFSSAKLEIGQKSSREQQPSLPKSPEEIAGQSMHAQC